jgi:cytochrome c biogenesis protein CcmG, thiol:disulfide interchange protein DsbE
VRNATPILPSPSILRAISLLLVTAVFASGCDRGDQPTLIGTSAPQFTVSDGIHSADLAKLRGRIVIVNFWATWCVPCIEELPSLLEMQHRLPGVTVVAIGQDEDADVYSNFLQKYHVDMLTVRDPTGRVPTLYGTQKIPESYVIDRNGILRRKFVSAQNWTSPEILDYLSKLEKT